MSDTIAILDANAVISLGQISDRINTPSLMDAFYSPEWQTGVTTTVYREVQPGYGNDAAIAWMDSGIASRTLREFNTDHIPQGRGAGEASIVAIIEATSGTEFIVVTDDARAGRMINRLDLEDVKVLNLQGYVESSLLTGGVNYADYMNIALESGWAPLGMSAGIGGLQFGRTTITNGVTIEATPEGLIITDVYGRQHYVSPTETFRISEDGRFIDPGCFPASTPIAISLTETRPISDIRVGDTVLAFDPAADLGRGALVPRKVVRLYRNSTGEWVKLTWSEGGEAKELIATPGHHFLDRFGNFPTIEEMLENGKATVVLATGALTEVTAERSGWRMAA